MWYGPILGVSESPDLEVEIHDQKTGENVVFRCEDAALRAVFSSMMTVGQILHVTGSRNQNRFRFHCTRLLAVERLRATKKSVRIRTTGASGRELVIANSSDKNRQIIDRLNDSLSSSKEYWIVEGKRKKLIDAVPQSGAKPKPLVCDYKISAADEFDGKMQRPITQTHAEHIFGILASASTPNAGPLVGIPYRYIIDGCNARCHAMVRLLLSEGVYPYKIWVHRHGPSRMLKYTGPRAPHCSTTWSHHTAPAVLSDQGPVVLDPSMWDRPVPVEEWAGKFSKRKHRKVYCTSFHIYHTSKAHCSLESDPQYRKTDFALVTFRNCMRLQNSSFGWPPCP